MIDLCTKRIINSQQKIASTQSAIATLNVNRYTSSSAASAFKSNLAIKKSIIKREKANIAQNKAKISQIKTFMKTLKE